MASKNLNGKNQNPKSDEIIYTIKKGDTLWSIANEMGVNIGALSRWNKLHPETETRTRRPAQNQMISDYESSEASQKGNERKEIIYVVKAGDTLWNIAKKYNLTVSEIKNWNNLDGTDRIYPADRLKLRVGGIKSSTLN